MSKRCYILTDYDFDQLTKSINVDPQRICNEVNNESERQKWNELWRIMNYRVVSWIREQKG